MSVLSVTALTQSFGRFHALDKVDLSLASGEVVGILGENGAGKSTLLNVLSGVLAPTSGQVMIDGRALKLGNYHQANLQGIWRIFQDPALIANLPVYENLFLGHEARFTRAGVLNRSLMRDSARGLIRSMGLDVDIGDLLLQYDFATRQALEVGRAMLLPGLLGLPAGFVLFDEPTTGLTRTEVQMLLDHIRQLRARGAGVAFVSHRLQEVFEICDRVVVLKDGAISGSGPISEFDEAALHRLMVGRDRIFTDAPRQPRRVSPVSRLAVEGLASVAESARGKRYRRRGVTSAFFAVAAGEIVGIGGLLGSGKGELLRLIAGIEKAGSGVLRLDGALLTGGFESRKHAGVAFISGDRVGEAIIASQAVSPNISLPSGHSGPLGFSNFLGFWRSGQELRTTRSMISDLGIKARPDQRVRALSGGNQQKVALARWLHRRPRLLLIENPTAGVDVGAKSEIYRLLRDLAGSGASILYVTDDLPELIGLSDRILIMRDGRLVANVDSHPDAVREQDLVAAMIGTSVGSSRAATPAHTRLS